MVDNVSLKKFKWRIRLAKKGYICKVGAPAINNVLSLSTSHIGHLAILKLVETMS